MFQVHSENSFTCTSYIDTCNFLTVSILTDHPFFVGVQYHPEYISRPMKPSPPYFGFLLASSGRLQGYINRGFRKSPQMSYEESSDEELSKFTDKLTMSDKKTDASGETSS